MSDFRLELLAQENRQGNAPAPYGVIDGVDGDAVHAVRIDVRDHVVHQAVANLHNVLSRKRPVSERRQNTTVEIKIYFA